MNKKEKIRYAVNQLMGLGNLNIIDSIFTTGYVAHAEDKSYFGHSFIIRYIKELKSSISDIEIFKVEFFAEEDDLISWQRILTGTHTSTMMGIPPSNKKIKWGEMVVSRFEAGKISEEWVVSELMGQLLLNQPLKK